MFGYKNGSQIEFFDDDITCSYDARTNDVELLELFCNIASDLECIFVGNEKGNVFEPKIHLLHETFKSSRAMSFMSNPKDTLATFKKKP